MHHDRRLHQLMLAEAECYYDLSAGKAVDGSGASPPALGASAPCSDSAGSMHSDLAAAAAAAAAAVKSGTSPGSPTGADDFFRWGLPLSCCAASWHTPAWPILEAG